MFVIIGFVVVIGAIVGGYLLEHGNLLVLFQPAELVIIFGAAIGTVLVANPLVIIIKLLKGISGVFTGSKYTTAFYMDSLKMLNELFAYGRKVGVAQLEQDVEDPGKSQVFSKYPKFLQDHHALHFVCDTLRLAVSGVGEPHELDQMMELEIDIHHQEEGQPVAALSTMADSLPGLGIVAAVLGVVITMGALGGPPEEIGHKVAAALVGTFLGILLCYGFFGPLASHMSKLNDAQSQYYHCLRVGLVAFLKGTSPIMAVEFARRAIPPMVRPTFQQMEETCRGPKQPQQ